MNGTAEKFIESLVIGALLLFLAAAPLCAESPPPEVRSAMLSAYSAFKDLQRYLVRPGDFEAQSNEAEILKQLGALKQSFHSAQNFEGAYTDQPGFEAQLGMAARTIMQAKDAFGNGQKRWARWRINSLTGQCIACHTTYDVKISFNDPSVDLSGLDEYSRGEFYLASRQFDKAQKAFFAAVLKPKSDVERRDALRRWLLIYTRINQKPEQALKKLQQVVIDPSLTSFQRQEIAEWIGSLKNWAAESEVKIEPLRKAENLMRQALGANDPVYVPVGTVELLRATGIVHRMLAEAGVSREKRSRGLYLLGFAYSKLYPYVSSELPELYLEECIVENPGTQDAQHAYRLYRDIVRTGYASSEGPYIEAEVWARLKELHDIAYGLTQADGRV